MKRKIIITILTCILISPAIFPQEILTLKECYELSSASNALAGEKSNYKQIWELNDKNISKGWLPSIDASGNFVYNSEVVDLSEKLGAIPGVGAMLTPLPHEQYKFAIDINQMLYDGGTIKNARAVEAAELRVNEIQAEADLYKLRSQINNVYFSILLVSKQKEVLDNFLILVEKRLTALNAANRNGLVIKSDIDLLEAEKIKLQQQISENQITKASLFRVLSMLTGKEISNNVQLTIPVKAGELTDEIIRPELKIYDIRVEQLTAGSAMLDSKRMPKAFAFATLGYGNPPGNNFFKDQFAPYFMAGAGIKWNIYDWGKTKSEKQVIDLKKSIVGNRKNDMTDSMRRLLESKKAEIESLKLLLESDPRLIILRQNVSEAAESQYNNGVITASDYLSELTAAQQALLDHEIHKINLAKAQIEYLNISGNDIQ